MRSRQIALDEVRGLAVLLVFLSHAANDGLLPSVLGQGAGQMGVLLFFMLSGYLMARIYGNQRFDSEAIRRFLIARVARIVPIYWVVLGVSAFGGYLGLAVHYDMSDMRVLVAAALMIHAPQELWSIPVEVQFYVVFLALWPWIFRVRLTVIRVAVAGCAVVGLSAATYALFDDTLILLTCALPFLIGLLCARIPSDVLARLGGLGVVAVLFLCLNLPGIRIGLDLEIWSGFYPRLWLDPFRYMAATLCLVTAIGCHGRWFAGQPLMYLGRISFGFYLLHRPVLRGLENMDLVGWPPEVVALVSFALSGALAAASFRWIEQPATRLLTQQRKQPRAPQPSAG